MAFGVVTIAFLALHASGDPLVTLLPAEVSQQELAGVRAKLGLDQPLYVQYGRFLADAVRGDFGRSFREGEPAMALVVERLPATIQLTAGAMGLAILVGVPLGVLAAVYRGSVWDYLAIGFAVLGQAIPSFWLGLVLILTLSVGLNWLPTSGSDGPIYLIMPVITLGWYTAASIARMVRTSMLEVLGQEYLVTARAKGLNARTIIVRHALKNAAIPVVTLIGIQLGSMLGGAVVVETIFSWPGVGRLLVQSILGRDYPAVQAAIFLLAMTFVVLNMLVDLVNGYLDPRMRAS